LGRGGALEAALSAPECSAASRSPRQRVIAPRLMDLLGTPGAAGRRPRVPRRWCPRVHLPAGRGHRNLRGTWRCSAHDRPARTRLPARCTPPRRSR
jgi:hypothetical protein